tara:strand:- start:35203 stop:36996 length:1794 start_codon:yes stop_codon:yes gene_type:complete
VTRADDLQAFFEQVWKDTEGYVYLPVKGVTGFRKFMIPWPRKKEAVVQHVLKYAADETAEVFYSPALYKSPKPEQKNVLGSWVAWAEFDGNAPVDWPTDISPIPTIEIQSSIASKRHVYWELKEFASAKQVQDINRALAYALGADLSGWDANQFLRPPGSTHRKDPRHPLTVTLLHNRLDRTYDREAFAHIPEPKEAIQTSIELHELPPLDEVLAEAKWSKELLSLFKTSGDEMQSEGRDRSGALQRLAYEGAEHGWTDEQIMVVLLDADDRWGKYKGRSTRQKILVDLINRARMKVGYDAPTELEGLALALSADVPVESDDDDRVLFSVGELATLKGIEDWIVTDLMTPRGLGLFTGRPGVGKTQLSFQLAADIAAGRGTFLGRDLQGTPQKVLYLSLEMNKHQLPHIAVPLNDRYPDMDQSNLMVYAKGERLPLDQDSGQAYFEALVGKFKPAVVFIDSLSHMVAADLSSDKEMKEAFEFLQRARNQFDFSVVIVHHHRKKANDAASRKNPNSLSDVYGSFYITAAVDFVLDLEVLAADVDEETITMSLLKNRYARIPEPIKLVRNDKLHFDVSEDLVKRFTEGVGEENGPTLGL